MVMPAFKVAIVTKFRPIKAIKLAEFEGSIIIFILKAMIKILNIIHPIKKIILECFILLCVHILEEEL